MRRSVSAGSYSSRALTAISSVMLPPSRTSRHHDHRTTTSSAPHVGGVVWAWGWGKGGQLGLGSVHNGLVPRALHSDFEGQPLAPVVAVACGHEHMVVLTRAGRYILSTVS